MGGYRNTTMRTTLLGGFVTLVLCGVAAASPGQVPDQKTIPAESDKPWAFRPMVRPSVPAVANKAWVRNSIDAFILANMEKAGVKPAKEANKATLIRRLTFDLTGLPPTPEEVASFLSDETPDAYEKVVDRLLASPRYGERWAMHWLDLVRYADSDGFKADDPRPLAWRYRDYVINAFNQDKPYDRFVLEQLAGDELFPDDPDALVATGFNRNYPSETNAKNIELHRQENLNDMTDTTGLVFLGLTHRLRPLPRSQVRSDLADRLLPPASVLRRLSASDDSAGRHVRGTEEGLSQANAGLARADGGDSKEDGRGGGAFQQNRWSTPTRSNTTSSFRTVSTCPRPSGRPTSSRWPRCSPSSSRWIARRWSSK